MERRFTYVVDQCEAGITIEQYLKKRGYSRQVMTHLKRTENGILLDGNWAYTRDTVAAGSRLDIRISEEGASEKIAPVCLPFDIVYEDKDLMVVNKPGNMPVHPSMNHHDNTLANAVAWSCREKGEYFPYRCINRLDRNTTGLLILAKHMLSAAVLYGQMRERKIRRIYLAIVKGRLEHPGGTARRHPLLGPGERGGVYPYTAPAGDRAHPSDPRAYELFRASSAGGFSVLSRRPYNRQTASAFMEAFVQASYNRRKDGIYPASSGGYGILYEPYRR